MSMVDGLVLDSLLNPPVVTQETWLAIRTDAASATGSGTQADPYAIPAADATTTTQDLTFDSRMRAIVSNIASTGNPMTVRLQPGTYYTRGFRSAYSGSLGWSPGSKLRLVGSGIGVTKLMMTSQLATSSGGTPVIGNNVASDSPDGIEISDLSIDCNGGGTTANQSPSGIDLTGSNIFVRRVEVTGMGRNGTNTTNSIGICVAHARSGFEPFNCVIENCRVRLPGRTDLSGGLIGLRLVSDASGAHHLLCVIRDSLVDFADALGADLTSRNIGICAGGGTGTIVECNSVRNMKYGASWGVTTGATGDLLFRENTFTNVALVFADPDASATGIDRIIFLNNVGEWPIASGTGSVAAPYGILLDGSSSSSTTIFNSVIARNNVFRRPMNVTPSNSEVGISLKNCSNAIVENNVADVGASLNNGFSYSVCDKVKAFNNRKPDGTFLQGYNTTSSLHLPELTTDVEDALLAL